MIASIDHQPFTLPVFKRKLIEHPRLYLKDETYFKRSHVALTNVGIKRLSFAIGISLILLNIFWLMRFSTGHS